MIVRAIARDNAEAAKKQKDEEMEEIQQHKELQEGRLAILKMTIASLETKSEQEVSRSYNRIAEGLREYKEQFEVSWKKLVEQISDEGAADKRIDNLRVELTERLYQMD